MRDIALTLFVLAWVPVAFKRPYIGVLVFAWLGYMNPHRFTWGFAYSLPFAALIGAVTIAGFLFTRERDRLPANALMIVWMLWIFWMNLTSVFALNPDEVLEEWDRAMKIQLMSLLTVSLFQTRQKLEWLVWIVALSVGFYGIKGGFFVAATGGNYLVFGPQGTFFEGNNGLAVALMMVLPLFWYLRAHYDNKWIKRAMLVSALAIILAVLGSYSRGAALGLAAVTVYLVYKSRHRWKILPVLAVFGAVTFNFLPEQWFDRLSTIQTYEEDGSAMGRINAWMFAYNVAVDRPILGGGYNVFSHELFRKYAPNPEDFHDAHSIYFEALGEHGFVGLGLFLMLGWLSLRHGNRIRRRTRSRPDLQWAHDLASMLQVGLVGYAVAGAFVGMAYFDLYYHLVAMMLLTGILADYQLETEPGSVLDPVLQPLPWSTDSDREIAIDGAGQRV